VDEFLECHSWGCGIGRASLLQSESPQIVGWRVNSTMHTDFVSRRPGASAIFPADRTPRGSDVGLFFGSTFLYLCKLSSNQFKTNLAITLRQISYRFRFDTDILTFLHSESRDVYGRSKLPSRRRTMNLARCRRFFANESGFVRAR
jgi:hypothetical protein